MCKRTNFVVFMVGVVVFLSVNGSGYCRVLNVPAGYTTIQDAIINANHGDTVVVAPGVYSERINFSGKAITVKSENPADPGIVASTVIDAGGVGSVVTFANSEELGSVLSGFTITNGIGTLSKVEDEDIFWGAGIFCWEASPTIKNNVITGNDGTDVNVYGGGVGCYLSDALISNNTIKDNAAYAGGGILVIGGKSRIRNNLIYGNWADIGGGVVLLDGELLGNTLVSNTSTMGGNVYVGRYLEEGENIVSNNIIANAIDGYELLWDPSDGYEGIKYNNFWNNAGGNYSNIPDQTGLNGNIFSDPLFVNADGHDYHLLGDSPCINAGPPYYDRLPDERDIDGEERVYAGRVDIGADEYTGVMKPRANAGEDQVVYVKGSLVTLDGSGSYFLDPAGVKQYMWAQVSGPLVLLSDDTAVDPSFSVLEYGLYVFELVVSDGENDSSPDTVTVEFANTIPVADAGEVQYFDDIPDSVTLDGSGSYDANGEEITYRWRQIEGPAVRLSSSTIANPVFVPAEFGIYAFELIVNDGFSDSLPDTVGVMIGNTAPVADAGPLRYAGADAIVLDGTSSYDPEGYGSLTYQWRHLSGPAVMITGADTATPTVSGFTQTSSVQECKFELVVSDGALDSEPDTVIVKIVPGYGTNTLQLRNPPFDPGKPTIVAFGGGNCNTGGSMSFGGIWEEKANWITTSYDKPYSKYGDMLIVYLSSVAPDYKDMIQTMGFSTGNMPAIDVANRINSTYSDRRYAVNRVSFLDAACRGSYTDYISQFNNNPVGGEQCWIDNYIATHSKIYWGTLNVDFPGGSHGTPVNWYADSAYESSWPNGDMYNNGYTAGFYYSVAGPGKNLQLAVDANRYHYNWNDGDPDYITPRTTSGYFGALPEAVTLVGPADGETLDGDGAVLSCEVSQNVVGYQLLMGPTPYDMTHVISDTPNPPEDVIKAVPYETTYWTIKARDQYGSTIYADPICVKVDGLDNPISNPFGSDYLDLIGYELLWKKRISRTEFEYCFKLKVKKVFMHADSGATVKISSVPDNITVIDDSVCFTDLPERQEVSSDNTFTVRIDHSMATNENDLIWEISDQPEARLPGDIDGNYMVNLEDIQFLAYNWLRSSVSAGLTGYWPLDESSGDIAPDMSGRGNQGTVNGSAEWTPSDGILNGGALSFDGIDDYIEIKGCKGIIGKRSRTVSAWIKTSSGGTIVNWGRTGPGGGDWTLSLNESVGWGGNTGALRVSVGGGRIVSTTDLRDGLWHHVASVLVNNGSPVTGEVKLYVDGEIETISFLDNAIINTVSDNDLLIGIYKGELSPFAGLIDEVRVYDRALAPQEIQHLYNNPSDDPDYYGGSIDLFDLADLAGIARYWQMQN